MTDLQLYLAIGVPILVNSTVLVTVLLVVSGALNKRLDDVRTHLDHRLDSLEKVMNAKFESVDARFEGQTQGLLRVEQVIDARLKHLEEKR